MNQRRGLQGLPRGLLGQAVGGELAQLVVDERQELGRRLRVALLNGGQNARYLAHCRHRH